MSSKFSTLVTGQIWCLVNLDMLDAKNTVLLLDAGQIWCLVNLDMINPKNTFLPLEWVHTLHNCMINLRNPPAITSYSGDWPRVNSSLVVSLHWFKMSSIMDFLSAMSLSHLWDFENNSSLRSEWWGTWGFVLEIGVTSTIFELIRLLLCTSYDWRVSKSSVSTITIAIAILGVSGAFTGTFAARFVIFGPQTLFRVY